MQDLKEEFPIFKNNQRPQKPFVFLDSAVSTHKPKSVIEAMSRFQSHDYGSIHRGAYSTSVKASQIYEKTKEELAEFLSPSLKSKNIIFTKNTTESLNILANGLSKTKLTEHDRIALPAIEHHANLVPWQQAALATNCEIAYIPMKSEKDLTLNLDAARKLISKNTKILTFAYVGNVLGQINPIEELIEMGKDVQATIIIDCAQSVTSFTRDLFSLGADAIAFSGHKIYGPTGIGVLAMRDELVETLPPLLFGGGMVSSVSLEESRWLDGPEKFEAGTHATTEIAGLLEALKWLKKISPNAIHKHCSYLNSVFLDGLKKIPDMDIYSQESGLEFITSFRHRRLHAHDLATILDHENISMRAGHHCAWPLIKFLNVDALLRASFGAYTSLEDVEIALRVLRKVNDLKI